MSATRLKLYNGALRALGERRLSSLTENREPRRVLDGIWDADFIRRCLRVGQWKWATRSVRIEYSSSVTPAYGYQRAFAKPSDFVRTVGLTFDERGLEPIIYYADEAGYWSADLDTLYAWFVSDAANRGGDLTLWPEDFQEYVELELAVKACPRLVNSQTDLAELKKDRRLARDRAAGTDAQSGPTKFMPRGTWSSSRLAGGGWMRRERGW